MKRPVIIDEDVWFDLVSIKQIKEELDQKVRPWNNKTVSAVDNCKDIACDTPLTKRVLQHLDKYEVEEALHCNVSLDLPVKQIEDSVMSSRNGLIVLIETNQNLIFERAKYLTELSRRIKQLNSNYKNWVPQEFSIEDSEALISKTCYKGSGPKGCSGPANFRLKVQKYIRNEKIHERIDSNRADHHVVQEELMKFRIYELCCASLQIENYIESLSEKMKTSNCEDAVKLRAMGISLFYQQLESIEKNIEFVDGSSLSRQFFASTIDTLGKEFIDGEEDQLLDLAKAILKLPQAGSLAFHFFKPNVASVKVFIDVYTFLLSSVMKYSPSSVIVLFSKINLYCWLTEKKVGYCDRRNVFKAICGTVLLLDSNLPEQLLPVYYILKKHYSIILDYMFPELYTDAVKFLLNGMENTSNNLCHDMWYQTLICLGCKRLKESSSVQEIECDVKKFAQNLQLPADQQMHQSTQLLNISQVKETMEFFQNWFTGKRKSNSNLYKKYEKCVKPVGIFLAILSNSLLSLLLSEDSKGVQNIHDLWKSVHEMFYPWLHPTIKEDNISFPWSDEESSQAEYMFRMFAMCIRYFQEKLVEQNCERCLLSYIWEFYIEAYVSHGLRHYLVSVCHTEFLDLPWHQFHPNSEDIEGMCKVLKSDIKESKEFLAKISMKIPWIRVMESISVTKPPDYIGRTLGTLGKLLIISGRDETLNKKNFHQNNMKSLECLPWHYMSLDDTEALLNLYYSSNDQNLLSVQTPNVFDCDLQFLKLVCCMSTKAAMSYHYNSKQLLFLRKYITALNTFIESKKESVLKDPSKFKIILPSLLKDVEEIIVEGTKPEQQINAALPLTREILGFLNDLSDPQLVKQAVDSVVSWLNTRPQSLLLLPCLQTACQCLKSDAVKVAIAECCLVTRFSTEILEPNEANSIWQLVSSCFQVPLNISDNFARSCVNQCAHLTLYCYILNRTSNFTSVGSKKLLLQSLIDWIKRSELSEKNESKSLLLWDKVLELCIMLAHDNELQVVQKALSYFCSHLSLLGEDKIGNGLLAAFGLGQPSPLSVNFRFLCRVMSAFILLQVPENASIRLEAMASGYLPVTDNSSDSYQPLKNSEPSPSSGAHKALINLKGLLKNKSYSALRAQINDAIQYAINPRHCLLDSREFLKKIALCIYPKDTFLYSLSYTVEI
ncbi:ectopic P granules protein 5 homolog [Stegodyphus dumicola]|uniref:ectopic P granules protein 5 homolog n=1 Tax=Stegodyphus dumicola TaxID=202533 RepID=UPI0015B194CC|nr:ectopic P granules protein 5 homolog [Stegodyphus dumicola]